VSRDEAVAGGEPLNPDKTLTGDDAAARDGRGSTPRAAAHGDDTNTPTRTPLLSARGLSRRFVSPRENLFQPGRVTDALKPVDLDVYEGDTLAVIGESGSGKSTLVRLLLALDAPSSGTVTFDGRPVAPGPAAKLRWLRRETGIIFQDPYASLDPRMTVGRIVAEPLTGLGIHSEGGHRTRVVEVLEAVGLDAEAAARYPHEFSGGQRQRIALARAIVHGPRLLVGDEPLSALDVTVRARILDLLAELRASLGLTLVIVSHDIGVIQHLSTRVAVMTEGEIVEQGPTMRVLGRPEHPYTRRLLSAVPTLDA
jgi:ABC-type glutathione transport system ATPase component